MLIIIIYSIPVIVWPRIARIMDLLIVGCIPHLCSTCTCCMLVFHGYSIWYSHNFVGNIPIVPPNWTSAHVFLLCRVQFATTHLGVGRKKVLASPSWLTLARIGQPRLQGKMTLKFPSIVATMVFSDPSVPGRLIKIEIIVSFEFYLDIVLF